MDTGDLTGVAGADRSGFQAFRPAPGLPRHGARSAVGAVAVPEPYLRAWEGAYRQYGQIAEMASRMPADDPAAAWHLATASSAVATAWREIATVVRLPWWLLAAVESAAEAFESQARYWEARENSAGSAEGGPA
jgi:hypothetical protein